MVNKVTYKAGFTLVEAMAAITLLVVALALAMGGFMFMLKNINQDDAQDELDVDVQQTMERLKHDMRLSSLDEIFYYADEAGSFQALSFPLGQDADGNGILDKDVNGAILWGAQVIYHIRPTTPHQLVKTVFSPRDVSLSDQARQAQLESVVATGSGTSASNSQNANSTILFENLLRWEILPIAGRFDAYSPDIIREKATLGYVLLPTGTHTFTFKTVAKNASSSGFKIGIDQLYVSPSYGAREAETQTVVGNSGAVASAEYMPFGSWKGRQQLSFPATAAGQSFTLSMQNDRWEETNFNGRGHKADADDTVISFNPLLKDFVVTLRGKDQAWDTSSQTGDDFGGDTLGGGLASKAVRILLKGSELADNGSWIGFSGERCNLTFAASSLEGFRVSEAYIGESSSLTNASMDYAGTPTAVTFSGGGLALPGNRVTSNWVDLPIDRTKNYLVSFQTSGLTALAAPKQWVADPTDLFGTVMVVDSPSGGLTDDASWSSQPTAYYTNLVFGLESAEVSYPATGKYTSKIFDTHLASPNYASISRRAIVPPGTTLALKVRSGNQPDLSDASDFSTIAASSLNNAAYKRYTQFQAIMTSDTQAQYTPILRDVTITWPGEEQLVDIGGYFTKGPGYGIFEIIVDGNPLRAALVVDLEIFKKDVRGLNNQNRRISSSLKVDITPRNSGL